MEVASPLHFSHAQGGTKRRFACSPPLVDSTGPSSFASTIGVESSDCDVGMDESYTHAFKRRRFLCDENTNTSSSGNNSFHSFMSPSLVSASGLPISSVKTPVTASANGSSSKRSRRESHSSPHTWNQADAQQQIVNDLQRLVDHQTTEIDRLKSEKTSIEASLSELKSTHEKTVNENRILKRAVTIQQERQNHAASELEGARRFKLEAEDRIRKLEQMVLTLRYHLQAQQPSTGNDFLGFNPRPPDVF